MPEVTAGFPNPVQGMCFFTNRQVGLGGWGGQGSVKCVCLHFKRFEGKLHNLFTFASLQRFSARPGTD